MCRGKTRKLLQRVKYKQGKVETVEKVPGRMFFNIARKIAKPLKCVKHWRWSVFTWRRYFDIRRSIWGMFLSHHQIVCSRICPNRAVPIVFSLDSTWVWSPTRLYVLTDVVHSSSENLQFTSFLHKAALLDLLEFLNWQFFLFGWSLKMHLDRHIIKSIAVFRLWFSDCELLWRLYVNKAGW